MNDDVRHRLLPFAPVAVVAAVAGALCLAMSRFQTPTTADSGAYLGVAANVRRGRGVTVPFNFFTDRFSPLQVVGFHGRVPSTHFPPLYAIFLAVVTPPGVHVVDAARWAGFGLVLVDVVAVWLLTRRVVGRAASPLVMAAPAALLVFGWAWVEFHAEVASEGLFLPLSIAALLALVRALDERTVARDATLVVLLAAAVCTRYMGVALVATAALTLLFAARGSARARLARAAAVTVASLVPIGVFVVWGAARAHGGESRVLGWHPAPNGWYRLGSIVGTTLLPSRSPGAVCVAFALVMLALAAVALVWWPRPDGEPTSTQRRDVAVLFAFVILYGVMLLAARALFDASTPVDVRLVVPMIAPLYIVVVAVMAHVVRSQRAAATVAVVLVAAVSVVHFSHVRAAYRIVSHSSLVPNAALARVGAPAHGKLLLTNDPAGVFATVGSASVLVPDRYRLTEGTRNPAYERELCELNILARGQPVLVDLSNLRVGVGVATRRELARVLSLESIARSPADEVFLARARAVPAIDCSALTS